MSRRLSDREIDRIVGPLCEYCGAVHGLRIVHRGYGSIPAEYTCEACFKGQDDGPCFDDLPAVGLITGKL